MIKQFTISGLDLTRFVVQWGQIEDVKEVLLAKTTFFAGSHQLVLDNSDGRFSTDNAGSVFKGINFYNIPGKIIVDGKTVFFGVLKDIEQDRESRLATFIFENALSKPLDARLSPQTNVGVNPVSMLLSILKQIDVLDFVDQPSFASASAPSLAVGAVIDFTVKVGSITTALASLQTISELASVSVFVKNGLLTAKAFRPYKGNESALGPEITPTLTRAFKVRRGSYTAFYNQVSVPYGSAGFIYTQSDTKSIGNTGVTKVFSFTTATGSDVAIPNLQSAVYFGNAFIIRSASIPVVITCEMGPEFYKMDLGDRFPVTASNWGYIRKPFEIIEAHRSLEEQAVELVLRNL